MTAPWAPLAADRADLSEAYQTDGVAVGAPRQTHPDVITVRADETLVTDRRRRSRDWEERPRAERLTLEPGSARRENDRAVDHTGGHLCVATACRTTAACAQLVSLQTPHRR